MVPIHNYGEIDGRLYVDMRLIEGSDLQAVLADGPLEAARAIRIIGQVALALNAAQVPARWECWLIDRIAQLLDQVERDEAADR